MLDQRRIQPVTANQFRELLYHKMIVPASLDDVHGTHHRRPLYRHPNTAQFYVAVKGSAYFVVKELKS